LVRYLTSKEQQRKRAEYSYLPTFKSLYQDTLVLRFNPFFVQVYESLENAVARPSAVFGKAYPRASTEIFNMINTIISDNIESSPEDCRNNVVRLLNRLNKKLIAALDNSKKVKEKKSTAAVMSSFVGDVWRSLKSLIGIL